MQADLEAAQAHEKLIELSNEVASLQSVKRRLEGEVQTLQFELDEALTALKSADEKGRKATTDATKLADELRQEQEHSANTDRAKKALEQAVKVINIWGSIFYRTIRILLTIKNGPLKII